MFFYTSKKKKAFDMPYKNQIHLVFLGPLHIKIVNEQVKYDIDILSLSNYLLTQITQCKLTFYEEVIVVKHLK